MESSRGIYYYAIGHQGPMGHQGPPLTRMGSSGITTPHGVIGATPLVWSQGQPATRPWGHQGQPH
jgi:hypothetical protein